MKKRFGCLRGLHGEDNKGYRIRGVGSIPVREKLKGTTEIGLFVEFYG